MTNPREEYLDFNIKLTEQLFGVKFKGKTSQDKEDFNSQYEEQRKEEVTKILNELHDEFTSV